MNNNEQKIDNTIEWILVGMIDPNPFQPRTEFIDDSLDELADSIKQYGILQPLTVSRITQNDGTLRYELVAGERRLRASKLAGLERVPAIVRLNDDSKTKLELAIIENLQREDLNPVDRATAFMQLATEFNLSHTDIGKRMGKSREYVSNSLRLLALPKIILDALRAKKISEGHTRPLLMLADKPDQQTTLFQDIVNYKLSVRAAEARARKDAQEKVRKEHLKTDSKILNLEQKLSDTLQARVAIESSLSGIGGRLVINYTDPNQLAEILQMVGTANGDTDLLQSAHSMKTPDISEMDNSSLHSGFAFNTGFVNDTETSTMFDDVTVDEPVISNQKPHSFGFDIAFNEQKSALPEVSVLEIPSSQTYVQYSASETMLYKQSEIIDPVAQAIPVHTRLDTIGDLEQTELQADLSADADLDILEHSNISETELDTMYVAPQKTQNNQSIYDSLFNI